MQPDWRAAEEETVALLQSLIRFDTTNPPGNELPLATFIASLLETEGIETRLLVPVPNRATVVARLRGNGRQRPVMLLSHMDVVGVERDKWDFDPFEGVVQDGYLYGRGAIDDKGMLAANLMTVLLLRRRIEHEGLKLERDVVFVTTADEETGGQDGMTWLVAHHPELLDAEFAINEGGRTRIIEGGTRYLAVQTSEKISHKVLLTARGPAGHAAIPLAGNAVFALARALEKLSRHQEPVTLTATTRRFFEGLAEFWPERAVRDAMRGLVSADRGASDNAAKTLAQTPVFNAVMRNGISPTMLSGGVAGNVIPAETGATLNVRTIPGELIEDVIRRMEACVDDPAVTITIESRGDDQAASDADSTMFRAIVKAAHTLDPEMPVVPYLSTGGTDSAHLRRIGINAYGLLPFPMVQSDEERMHGHNERVPLQSLHFGTRLIYESILEIAAGAGQKPAPDAMTAPL
ncbi:MAG: M20/M25/M40 family metallo-hydrolase [Gemmatimonadaceae bacterium]